MKGKGLSWVFEERGWRSRHGGCHSRSGRSYIGRSGPFLNLKYFFSVDYLVFGIEGEMSLNLNSNYFSY